MKLYYLCLSFLWGLVRGQNINQAPRWVNSLQQRLGDTGGLIENTPVGTIVGYLKAVDPEGQTVTYSTTSRFFSVDANSGEVRISQRRDFEPATQNFKVKFIAYDSVTPIPNQSIVEYTVIVIDVNDNAPQFLNVPYSAKIDENSEVDSLVFDGISISDLDRGQNAVVTLKCYDATPEAEEACRTFSIHLQLTQEGKYTGSIRLKTSPDFEVKRSYTMTLQARDRNFTTLQNVVIEVNDLQDSPPVFINAPLSFQIKENTPGGKLVGVIRAKDNDEGNPRNISITMLSDPENFFRLDTAVLNTDKEFQSNIRSNGNIDREKIESSNYVFKLRATEITDGVVNGSFVDTEVTMTIIDENDNGPVFSLSQYQLSVPEELNANTRLPEFFLTVADKDLNSNAHFSLSLEGDTLGSFSIKPTSANGSASISLVVRRPENMDYDETDRYRVQRVKVVAREVGTQERHSSTATITVYLKDINDNIPTFTQSSYEMFLREDKRPGYQLNTITATDRDSGIFGKVEYAIIGNDKFEVNNETGLITLSQAVDFDTGPSRYALQYCARDGGGRKNIIPLYVTVTDFNDKAPIPDSDNYNTEVRENVTQMVPEIRISATDTDNLNANITYTISSGNTADRAFVLNPTTGQLSLRRKVAFNETENNQGIFVLVLNISDNGNPPQIGKTRVTVTILDVNDHKPSFTRKVYTANVTELTPPLTYLETLKAEDGDRGSNAEVEYFIHLGGRDNFAVEPRTGQFRVNFEANLDRAVNGDKYNVIVYAVDKGQPQQTGTATVVVNVYDSNNKMPQFDADTFFGSIKEDISQGSMIDMKPAIHATDSDTTSSLRYSIVPDSYTALDRFGKPIVAPGNAFTIDATTGQIKTNLPSFNRDQAADITFQVKVEDLNAEDPALQTATASVIITISEKRTGGPVFDPPWTSSTPRYTFNLTEDRLGGYLITTLSARDPINNRPITYQEIGSDDIDNNFRVESSTGRIYLNRALDYDRMSAKVVSFRVAAVTQGGDQPHSAIAQISVFVKDVNDNAPSFEKNLYIISIPEDSSTGVIENVKATDIDSTGSDLRYSISGQRSSDFVIDPVSGDIRIADGVVLDRETHSEYTLFVTVSDSPKLPRDQRRSTSVPLKIILQDSNDSRPRFDKTQYNLFVLENVDRDASLGRVTATDADIGINGRVEYHIESGNVGNLFAIDRSTGIIRATVSLKSHAQSNAYIFTIRATDQGVPQRSDSAIVTIKVQEVQAVDRKPKFLYPNVDSLVISVEEERPGGLYITTIRAEAFNSSQRMTYKFLENGNPDHNLFHINQSTGMITVKKNVTLDRETKELYELILLVYDQSNPANEQSRRILVKLQDKNDNKPLFGVCEDLADPVVVTVEENQLPKEIIRLSACDRDAAPNNNIYYYIISGNSEGHFSIDKKTGSVYTQTSLDRELVSQYLLHIKASNDPNWRGGSDITDHSDKSIVRLQVRVGDVDDNPVFFYERNRQITAGVLVNAQFRSLVATIRASDLDTLDADKLIYSIEQISFIKTNGDLLDARDAFYIDPKTGELLTNKVDYVSYIGGHFELTITATDGQGRIASSMVYIYVIRESDRLKFVFNRQPNLVRQNIGYFVGNLTNVIKTTNEDIRINIDELRYHSDENGGQNFGRTDACFNLVKGKSLIGVEDTMATLSFSKPPVKAVYDKYGVVAIGSCVTLGALSTYDYNSYAILWWLIIATAILLFLIALLLIILLCCFWSRYKKKARIRETYLVRPVIQRRDPQYEWQESSMKVAPNERNQEILLKGRY